MMLPAGAFQSEPGLSVVQQVRAVVLSCILPFIRVGLPDTPKAIGMPIACLVVLT